MLCHFPLITFLLLIYGALLLLLFSPPSVLSPFARGKESESFPSHFLGGGGPPLRGALEFLIGLKIPFEENKDPRKYSLLSVFLSLGKGSQIRLCGKRSESS